MVIDYRFSIDESMKDGFDELLNMRTEKIMSTGIKNSEKEVTLASIYELQRKLAHGDVLIAYVKDTRSCTTLAGIFETTRINNHNIISMSLTEVYSSTGKVSDTNITRLCAEIKNWLNRLQQVNILKDSAGHYAEEIDTVSLKQAMKDMKIDIK